MRTLAGVLPWFLPGLAITTVIALAVAGRVARRLRTESWIAFLLVMSVGAALAAPIPPDADGFSSRPSAPGRCEFGRIGLAPLSQYLHLGDTSLNATERSRISGLRTFDQLAHVLTWPVVVGGVTLGQHIDHTKG
ncbi:MAG: VanZ family protein [Mycobacterium sp.]|nr:VanZ family protein [Mycobacterium sp.]